MMCYAYRVLCFNGCSVTIMPQLCLQCVVFQQMQGDNYVPNMFAVCCVSTNAVWRVCPNSVYSVLWLSGLTP